jgi:transforming growth factor-beta-induced protein
VERIGSIAAAAVLSCVVLAACQGCGKKERAEPKRSAPQQSEEAVPPPEEILDVAIEDGSFTTFIQAVNAAGLAQMLKGKGPFTVFAPTDDAFAKLPPGTMKALFEDVPELRSVLLNHVVPGALRAADLVRMDTVTTATGERLRIRLEKGKVYVDGAKVVIPDVEASNGVLHMIDAVIVPSKR